MVDKGIIGEDDKKLVLSLKFSIKITVIFKEVTPHCRLISEVHDFCVNYLNQLFIEIKTFAELTIISIN